jgi:hypothetical protein
MANIKPPLDKMNMYTYQKIMEIFGPQKVMLVQEIGLRFLCRMFENIWQPLLVMVTYIYLKITEILGRQILEWDQEFGLL